MLKSVKIRIFEPGNKRSKLVIQRAPARHVFNDKGVDVILVKTAEQIEQRWPAEDYSLIPVGPGAFNFVHRGTRCEA